MADIFSAIGQGLGAVGGPLVSGGLNLIGGLMQQGSQMGQVNQQENFQQQMSDTAYQRSVADMTKAGLNPALMFGSGGPESSPAGASMSMPNVMQGVGSGAMDAMTTQKQLESMQSTIDMNKANTALAGANTSKVLAGVPITGLEGNMAKTVQSLLTGIENLVQGWGKTNASSDSISGLFGQLIHNAWNPAHEP